MVRNRHLNNKNITYSFFNRSPDIVMEHSAWNDDLKTWKIPDNCLLKLPPANPNSDIPRIYSSAGIKNNSSKDLKNEENLYSEHVNIFRLSLFV